MWGLLTGFLSHRLADKSPKADFFSSSAGPQHPSEPILGETGRDPSLQRERVVHGTGFAAAPHVWPHASPFLTLVVFHHLCREGVALVASL